MFCMLSPETRVSNFRPQHDIIKKMDHIIKLTLFTFMLYSLTFLASRFI